MIFVLFQIDQTGSGALSFGINRLLCESECSPPSAAEVENEWSYTCAPPVPSRHVQGRLYIFYSVTRNVTYVSVTYVSVIIMSQYCYSLFSPYNHS